MTASSRLIENSDLTLDAVAADPTDENQQTDFTLAEGDLLLRQPAPGNELAVFGPAGSLISHPAERSRLRRSQAGGCRQESAAEKCGRSRHVHLS